MHRVKVVVVNARRNRTPRQVAAQLRADGWIVKRKGPGDHVQYVHPEKPGKVTLDMGARPIPSGTLRSIYRQAGFQPLGREDDYYQDGMAAIRLEKHLVGEAPAVVGRRKKETFAGSTTFPRLAEKIPRRASS